MYIQLTVQSPWLGIDSTKQGTAHQDGKGHWRGINSRKPFPFLPYSLNFHYKLWSLARNKPP